MIGTGEGWFPPPKCNFIKMADLNFSGQDVDLLPATSLGNGQKTVTTAGTAEALAASTSCMSVTIKALAGNTNNVYVGDSGVSSSNGLVLDAGESISLDIDDLNTVYIDTDTNGEGVSFIYLVQ